MHLSYNNTVDDRIALLRHHWKTCPNLKRRRSFGQVVLPLVFIAIVLIHSIVRKDPFFIIPGTIVALLIFAWDRCANYFYCRKTVKRITENDQPDWFICRHNVAITRDGFEEKTDKTLNFYKWDSIQDIVFTPENIFIHVNSASAHVLPIRELGEQLFHQAGEEIKAHWKRSA